MWRCGYKDNGCGESVWAWAHQKKSSGCKWMSERWLKTTLWHIDKESAIHGLYDVEWRDFRFLNARRIKCGCHPAKFRQDVNQTKKHFSTENVINFCFTINENVISCSKLTILISDNSTFNVTLISCNRPLHWITILIQLCDFIQKFEIFLLRCWNVNRCYTADVGVVVPFVALSILYVTIAHKSL